MKMSEMYCVKWNDFQSVVSQSFSVLRREEDFYDVTLVSDDQTQIPAHKLVLSASSHFFKSILKRNSHSHPLLYLSGVDSKSLGFVLDYIYQGEVQIYQHDLDNFLEIAQKLKIEGLLSNEDPEVQTKERNHFKEESSYESFIDKNESSFKPSQSEKKFSSARSVVSEKVVSVRDMSDVDGRIEELMEKREGRYYCLACDYSSVRISNVNEHVEKHIEGLSFSCQFCDKTFRLRHSLRNHVNIHHRA